MSEAVNLVFQWIFVLNLVKFKFFHMSIVNTDCFDRAPEIEAFTESCARKKLFWKVSQILREKTIDEVLS